MKKLLKKKYRKMRRTLRSLDLGQLVYFIPGLFLVLLALAMVTAPSMSIFFVAGFFMASGFCLCFVAWKLLILKSKLESALKDVSGKIVIHGMDLAESMLDDDDFDEEKKVTYH